MRYQAVLTIPIGLRRLAPEPLYEQIAGQIGAAVDDRRLAARTALPSTRTLAGLLGVSRGVVAAAYDLLAARGYLDGRPGSGSYVTGPAGEPGVERRPPPGTTPAGLADLRPAGAGTGAFPVPAWRAAWRRASLHPPAARPPPPLGLPELRRALAAHLCRSRGPAPEGYQVVVTAGDAHGLRLVLEALGLAGSRVAVEEPAGPALWRAVPPGPGAPGPAGLPGDPHRRDPDRLPVPVPVDQRGARTGAVPPSCRSLVVTPDAHDPLGHILSAGRRREAAAWARRTGGWLVEIACDAVFRPEASRLPRLTGLAAGRCAVVGGSGPALTGLGLGYLVVPSGLAAVVGRLVAGRGEQPPQIVQRAAADLFADGAVVRMMHRLGRLHLGGRRLVEASLGGLVRLGGLDAVGTAVVHLPGGSDPDRVVTALRERGVLVVPLTGYYRRGGAAEGAVGSAGAGPPGLVVGYGHLPEPALRDGLARLAGGLAELAGPPRRGRR